MILKRDAPSRSIGIGAVSLQFPSGEQSQKAPLFADIFFLTYIPPLYLIPYTLYLIPYTLYLIPYTLYLIPYSLSFTSLRTMNRSFPTYVLRASAGTALRSGGQNISRLTVHQPAPRLRPAGVLYLHILVIKCLNSPFLIFNLILNLNSWNLFLDS